MPSPSLADWIRDAIERQVAAAGTETGYRRPLVGFAAADDPRFAALQGLAGPAHLRPEQLLPGARSVVSFFLPFAAWVVEANARHPTEVAREWVTAYLETNALIGQIGASLVDGLAQQGVRAAAEPATHNFDPTTLASRWSHKSVAVIAGLGSFGVHQMVITDAGCAGRFGSLVVDAELPAVAAASRERCLYLVDGSCLECVGRCPVGALAVDGIDKQRCYRHLLGTASKYREQGLADVCGKCALGPCACAAATGEL